MLLFNSTKDRKRLSKLLRVSQGVSGATRPRTKYQDTKRKTSTYYYCKHQVKGEYSPVYVY